MVVKLLLESFRTAMDEVSEWLEATQRGFHVEASVTEASSGFEIVFYAERRIIESVIKRSEGVIALERRCEKDKEFASALRRAREELGSKLEKHSNAFERPALVAIGEFAAPLRHRDPEVDEIIQRKFREVSEMRARFFEETKRLLSHSPRLREEVRRDLEGRGMKGCWHAIS